MPFQVSKASYNLRTKLYSLQIHNSNSKEKWLEAYRIYHLHLHCNSIEYAVTSVTHTHIPCYVRATEVHDIITHA